MKKLTFTLALALALAARADLKMGTVDLMALVRNHPDYDRNKVLLESTDKDVKAKVDLIKGEGEKLQSEGKSLIEQMRNPMITDKAKADIEKQVAEIQQKLMGIEQRYREQAARGRQELSDLEARLMKVTTEDLRKRITAFAEKDGYDFVLDKTAAPYAKEAYDVTDAILRDMGVDPAKAKGRGTDSAAGVRN